MWFFTAGIKNNRLPIKYAIIPPKYDMVANAKRKNQGETVFDDHAINISGGINPNTVSEIRNTSKIAWVEYVVTMLSSNESKSRKKYSNVRNNPTKIKIAIPPLIEVSFKNE
jgi:hypothetical protein